MYLIGIFKDTSVVFDYALTQPELTNRRITMKTMTCKQLGGACDKKFSADSFDEIAELSKQHGMEMFQKGDKAHLDAMNAMKDLMQDPAAMKAWFDSKKNEFNALPEN